MHQNVEALHGRLYQDNQARPSVQRCAKCHPNAQHSWPRSRTSSYLGSTKTRSASTWSTFGAKQTWKIAPGPRHVVLAAAHGARALALGRADIGLASLHKSLRLQAECSGSKIRHSASLSSQRSLQRVPPRLVTNRYTVGKSAMASTAPSFGKTSSVKGKRYSYLPAGPCSHGFKKCSGFQPSTFACRLRIFASDRTIPVSSNLSSTERCNCG